MRMNYLVLLFITIFIVGCSNVEESTNANVESDRHEEQEENIVKTNKKEETNATIDASVVEEEPTQSNIEMFAGYKLIEVDGGDLSGYREPNVVVDIGFGDREYWAFTNPFNEKC